MNKQAVLVLASTAALAACGGGGGDGEEVSQGSTTLAVSGAVLAGSESGGKGTGLDGATVKATVDRNGDGKIGEGESVSVATDFDGNYALEITADPGQTVVVGFRADGYAPNFRKVVAGEKGAVRLGVSLAALEALECTGERCAIGAGKLSIAGLRGGLSGSARVFNPVTETDQFPGGFDDSDGNLLISGVFSAVQLTDENGEEVHETGGEVELRMRMPVETWPVIVDLAPGGDRIDVPLYAFDETLGTWVRHDKDGWLEDENGAIISESALDSIRDGSYAGGVIATGPVDHFSYWNIDWPVESHGCVEGTLVTPDGAPAEGATIGASGVTYTGNSPSQSVGADGRFHVDVMRSEGPGEDVDQDGTTGETHQISLQVFHGGKFYDGGTIDILATQECGDTGPIELGPERELQPEVCALQGRVLDAAGQPMTGAMVVAWDDDVPYEMEEQLCGSGFENCDFMGTAAEDGAYSFRAPILNSATVWAMHSWEEERVSYVRVGQRTVRGCPDGDVDLRMTEGWNFFELVLSLSGSQIGWDLEERIDSLYVMSPEGEMKWFIWSEEGMEGPITYGTVPPGATAYLPADGSPAPLASGDTISVISHASTSADGIFTWGSGTLVVP